MKSANETNTKIQQRRHNTQYTLADLINIGLESGDNDADWPPLMDAALLDERQVAHIVAVGITPVGSRREHALYEKFSSADDRGIKATLSMLRSFPWSGNRLSVIASKMRPDYARELQTQHRKSQLPGLVSIAHVHPQAVVSHESCVDDSNTETFLLAIATDTTPVLPKILNKLTGAIGDSYEISSNATSDGGAIIAFRVPAKSPPLLHLLENAIDWLCQEIDAQHPEIGFTAQLYWRESAATIRRKIYPAP